ncbi:hypothetical protein MCB86_08975 [Pseudomonas sp. KSR10]|uniref:hypothetical protein n=1 Tax=Pseudomonas sp. KSR10 TaxID=2916654 RepID=UPI001EF7E70C|nr:hypothetical protein [Pseudomonas sp. KSR10]MCG6540206.1 hypothetical protein [Pseudomonas sp. KSR10]
MKPDNILLRCFAERKEGYWQAFCIDLNLAVQGDSRDEVTRKLHAHVYDYLKDIFEGEDRPFAAQLLTRKAPISLRARYYLIAALCHFHRIKDRCTFQDAMPLKLA